MYTCTCNNRHLAVYGLQFSYPLILLLLGLSSFSATATPLRVRQSDTRSRDAASGAGHGEADGQPMVRETQLQELLGTAVEVNRYKKAKHAHVVNTSQPCQLQLKHYNMPKGAQLLDLTNINACTHLAAAGLHDGYGAQLKRRLGVWAFALAHGLRYAHSPITQSKLHSLDEHVITELDAFLNYGHGELHLSADRQHPQAHQWHDISRGSKAGSATRRGKVKVCWVARCDGFNTTFVETHPEALAALQPLLSTKLRASDHRLHPRAFDPHRINVAVHIRRGDITQTAKQVLEANPKRLGKQQLMAMHRYVPEQWYHQVILEIAAASTDTGMGVPLFHLYSEGLAKDFPLLQDLDIHSRNMSGKVSTSSAPLQLVWHLDEDLGSTLAGMLYSDVFVMGHSSLSYIAALFRKAAPDAESRGGIPTGTQMHASSSGDKDSNHGADQEVVLEDCSQPVGAGDDNSASALSAAADSIDEGHQRHVLRLLRGKKAGARRSLILPPQLTLCDPLLWSAGLTLYHEQWQVAMPQWMKYTGPGSFGRGLRQQGALRSMQTALARRTKLNAGGINH